MDELISGEALLHLSMRLYRLQVEILDYLSEPLSVRQFRILDRVDRHISSMTELAALARRRPPTISKSVDSLVRRGLLTREGSLADRRVIALALTEKGEEILKEARSSFEEFSTWIGRQLKSETPALNELFDSIYDETESRLRPDGA